ncbi:ribosome maturation factor RimM [Chryseolinea lacunae]|uniref:Ribosome maturation factor RimM n=1 Tax=Chryseolinea lacunae TaxID=2801331 RepID=A0ABS1KV54_9BACT|nr:ribosome maturation factor RimM [Chryseolinea lacunae]MBL0743350.1 16S rRNA processing protein RimM [Chryseolinea lacunae]
MDIEQCFKIGFILKPHGLKGEVTVSLDEEAPENLAELKILFLEKDKRLVPYFIQTASVQRAKALVKFEDVDSIEDAEKISKHALYVEKSARPKSGRGEFYSDEVIGFEVWDTDAGLLGTIAEVQSGANPLLVVHQEEREVLVPVNGPFITGVNKSKKRINVNLPEGFLDI